MTTLGLVLSTVTEGPVTEFIDIARQAEARGFAAVFVNEGRGDALACAQAIAGTTENLGIGTNIANVYFRHPYLAASTARTIAELSGGRLTLGLGMSHRALLASLGIDMGDARAHLARYVDTVKQALAGEYGEGFLRTSPSPVPVPVYVAGNTVESAAIAGANGDGLMPFLTPVSHLPVLVEAAREAAAQAGRDPGRCGCILSMPTFVSEDRDAARSAARYNLAFFARLPNYRRQWRRAGFGAAMDAAAEAWASGGRHEAAAQIPDALVDEVCVFGTPAECRKQLAAFRDAGADLPVLAVSPVNEERLAATRRAIDALAPNAG